MCGIFNNGVLGTPPGYGDHPQVPGNVIQPPRILRPCRTASIRPAT